VAVLLALRVSAFFLCVLQLKWTFKFKCCFYVDAFEQPEPVSVNGDVDALEQPEPVSVNGDVITAAESQPAANSFEGKHVLQIFPVAVPN